MTPYAARDTIGLQADWLQASANNSLFSLTRVLKQGLCTDCDRGDSSTEPYIVPHNMLNAHAASYRTYKATDLCADGKTGITLNSVCDHPRDSIDATVF